METKITTTLQQRIEERAEKKLLKDLYEASQKEQAVENLIGNKELFTVKLAVRDISYRNYRTADFEIVNEFTKKVFEALLPRYITNVTDEILQKVDEIDWLVQNKDVEDF